MLELLFEMGFHFQNNEPNNPLMSFKYNKRSVLFNIIYEKRNTLKHD
jgi:hypothetical protein